jgi:hypothetical protein
LGLRLFDILPSGRTFFKPYKRGLQDHDDGDHFGAQTERRWVTGRRVACLAVRPHRPILSEFNGVKAAALRLSSMRNAQADWLKNSVEEE